MGYSGRHFTLLQNFIITYTIFTVTLSTSSQQPAASVIPATPVSNSTGLVAIPGHTGNLPSAIILPNGQIIPVVGNQGSSTAGNTSTGGNNLVQPSTSINSSCKYCMSMGSIVSCDAFKDKFQLELFGNGLYFESCFSSRQPYRVLVRQNFYSIYLDHLFLVESCLSQYL